MSFKKVSEEVNTVFLENVMLISCSHETTNVRGGRNRIGMC